MNNNNIVIAIIIIATIILGWIFFQQNVATVHSSTELTETLKKDINKFEGLENRENEVTKEIEDGDEEIKKHSNRSTDPHGETLNQNTMIIKGDIAVTDAETPKVGGTRTDIDRTAVFGITSPQALAFATENTIDFDSVLHSGLNFNIPPNLTVNVPEAGNYIVTCYIQTSHELEKGYIALIGRVNSIDVAQSSIQTDNSPAPSTSVPRINNLTITFNKYLVVNDIMSFVVLPETPSNISLIDTQLKITRVI